MSKTVDLSVSVVTYKNDVSMLKRLFDSLSAIELRTRIFVIDNSPADDIKNICNEEFSYIFNNKNIGFGRGHNIAIKRGIDLAKYHLVVNPDIYFERGTIERMYGFMESNLQIGLLMPKIVYSDGSLQHLCRILPCPIDLLLRKATLPFFTEHRNITYQLKFADYDRIMDVPFLSGCFMFIRTTALKKVGFFDERFFMYFEDLDLSRRIHKEFRTVYYPESTVVHDSGNISMENGKYLNYHIFSAMKYFNKWGWFFDRERARVNKEAIDKVSAYV